MRREEKLNLLNTYIKNNIAPILIENIPTSVFIDDATIIPSNISITELNGQYKEEKFIIPNWYLELKNKAKLKTNILVIDNFTKISKKDQMKFYELLKYQKINTLPLPKNCTIIIPCQKEELHLINKEIYSLIVHI